MTERPGVYLDYNATTPLDPRVREAMAPYFTDVFGNAASLHAFGVQASEAVEKAREQVAGLIAAPAESIVFTSGATESNNLAIKGLVEAYRGRGDHIITAATEHSAVLDPCRVLAARGMRVTYLPVDKQGRVAPEQVDEAITDRTILISIMAANNETGTLQPVEQIGRIAKHRGVMFHCDAVQAAGKVPLDVERMGVDLLSLSAHKMYGPKGAGCLYVRPRSPRVRLSPQIHGGGHERGLRSGTVNVPGIVGLGEAAELAGREMPEDVPRIARLRDSLIEQITSRLEDVTVNADATQRLANTASVAFAYVEGEAVILRMGDVACSTGSACSSAELTPSHVLMAMGIPEVLARGTLRFSLGRFTTQDEVDYAARQTVKAVTKLRELSPFYEPPAPGGASRT